MGFIKFRIAVRKTDELGNATRVVLRRLESDMADVNMLETNIIMNALATSGKVEKDSRGFPYIFPLIFKS